MKMCVRSKRAAIDRGQITTGGEHELTKRSVSREVPRKPTSWRSKVCDLRESLDSLRQSMLQRAKRWAMPVALLAGASLVIAQDKESVDVKVAGNEGDLVVKAQIVKPKEVPVFYTTQITNQAYYTKDQLKQDLNLQFNVVQGEAKRFSVQLTKAPQGLVVSKEGVKHWALRYDAELKRHYLDVFPADPKARALQVKVSLSEKYDLEKAGSNPSPLGFAKEFVKTVGFKQLLTVGWDKEVDLVVLKQNGYVTMKTDPDDHGDAYSSHGGGALTELQVLVTPSNKSLSPISLRDVEIASVIADDGKSARVNVKGLIKVRASKGDRILVARGPLALVEYPELGEAKLEIETLNGGEVCFYVVAKKEGDIALDVNFVAKVSEYAGWKRLAFMVPNGAVVPISASNFPDNVEFNSKANVKPVEVNDGFETSWKGFLPASGACDLAWRSQTTAGEGKLFFTTESITEVSVSSGLMKSLTQIRTKVLQGKIRKLLLERKGVGDVVGVTGKQVSLWKVNPDGMLEITLTGAYSSLDPITVEVQYPIGDFPAKLQPLRLTPSRAMRHAGYVRLSNRGAVKLGVSDLNGMMQLSPERFPMYSKKDVFRQVYVYRYPSKDRSWTVSADQILPEVSVRQNVVYHVDDTDRLIDADIEIDIREAPLREWSIQIPDGYAVSRVKGAVVRDYVLSGETNKQMRNLKFFFEKSVTGRHLIHVTLEKNLAAKAGEWSLPRLSYPGAKTVRGQVGIAAALGWRILPGKQENLSEIPLAYFQKKGAKVQQTYRQRQADWNASVKIEALGQSVQADVFHLYTLKEGVVECGVFLNYFVVGAPVDKWQLEVPDGAGNISVVGQDVRSWRRDGNRIIVSLQQPALGGVNLFVKYEQSMSADGGQLQLGQVVPFGVQNESGYIQVISPMQVKHSVKESSKSLLKLTAAELPAEYRLLTTVPSIGAWQYSARPFSLEMNIEWYEPSATVGQSIDYATMVTSIGKGGQIVTEAEFFVKTRGRNALRMKLPQGAQLWEVRADGKRLNARKDGDQILLSLPADQDINIPVKVKVRYGSQSDDSKKLTLGVPVFSAPSVITNWRVESQNKQLLMPVGGNVETAEPTRTQTGFEWLQHRTHILIGMLALLIGGSLFVSAKTKWMRWVGACWLVLLVGAAVVFLQQSIRDARPNQSSFEVVAPALEANQVVTLEVAHLSSTQAMLHPIGLIVFIAGIAALVASAVVPVLRSSFVKALALLACCGGLLAQYGGASFFMLFVMLLGAGILILHGKGLLEKAPKAAQAAVIALGGIFLFSQPAEAADRANSVKEVWNIKDDRLHGSYNMKWQAKVGDRIQVLRQPGILTKFTSDSARVVKSQTKGNVFWYAVAEVDGLIEADVSFEMPMPKMLNLAEKPWVVTSAPAAMRSLAVNIGLKGMEVQSTAAIQTKALDNPTGTSVELVLSPVAAPSILIRPKRRDPDKEPVKFFAETQDLYTPAPGVLDGLHDVIINPVSGRIRNVNLVIPEGLMVGDVVGKEVNTWSYDPSKRMLAVSLTRPMTQKFIFRVTTQQGLKALPVSLKVSPVRVDKADKVVGMLALGFGNDAQPDAIKVSGMAAANIGDFSPSLTQAGGALRAGFVVHTAYRYGVKPAEASFKVQPVAPELRVITNQQLQISDERLLLQVVANAGISRAGVFKLRMPIPKGFEVESVTGGIISDWNEVTEKGKRLLNMNLNGKTMGSHQVVLVLSSNAPGAVKSWSVPRCLFEDAVRQTGSLVVLPEQGVRATAVTRKHISQIDPRKSGLKHPGALAFRMLEANWELTLNIEKLDPWVTATMLQEVMMREGQTRVRAGLEYNVRHAAVKRLMMRIPNLDEEEKTTVRASGAAVKEIRHVKDDMWEVLLRRGVIGRLQFDVEYQLGVERKQGVETIDVIALTHVQRVENFVAVRTFERLDMQALNLDKNWRVHDWNAVSKKLKNKANTSAPGLCYRVTDVTKPIKVQIRRHAIAGTLKLRVVSGELTTLFSQGGGALTHMIMSVEVAEKSSMRVALPEGAELFSVMVNGNSVPVVAEAGGKTHSFHVTTGRDPKKPSLVQVVYSNPSSEEISTRVKIKGPKFDIPIENVAWNLILPKGYQMKRYGGDFEYDGQLQRSQEYRPAKYLGELARIRSARANDAKELMSKVNEFIRAGDRDKATWALNQVSNNYAVDRAYNLDAQEKLKKMQTQHALMGLNTRRQKLYLDNKAEGNDLQENRALEEAASRNPLFKGSLQYDPQQVEDFMQGMSEEERNALNAIAKMMVDPQLKAVHAPQPVEVTMPLNGDVLQFKRDIQLGGDGLEIDLELAAHTSSSQGQTILILVMLGVGMFVVGRKVTK